MDLSLLGTELENGVPHLRLSTGFRWLQGDNQFMLEVTKVNLQMWLALLLLECAQSLISDMSQDTVSMPQVLYFAIVASSAYLTNIRFYHLFPHLHLVSSHRVHCSPMSVTTLISSYLPFWSPIHIWFPSILESIALQCLVLWLTPLDQS